MGNHSYEGACSLLSLVGFLPLCINLNANIKGIGGYDVVVRENKEYLEELCALAKELGLAYAIHSSSKNSLSESRSPTDAPLIFLPSFTNSQRTWLLRESLCLLYTPSFEHFGIVPIEAMLSKLPVIAVNNGGPTESIIHGETGFLCDPNPDSFAQAVKQILPSSSSSSAQSTSKRALMGTAGRERVLSLFSLDSFTDALEGHIQATLDDVQGGAWTEAQRTWALWVTLLLGLIALVLGRVFS